MERSAIKVTLSCWSGAIDLVKYDYVRIVYVAVSCQWHEDLSYF